MRRSPRPLCSVSLAAACLAAGCAGSGPRETPGIPAAPIATSTTDESGRAGPRWHYHPPHIAPMHAAYPLGGSSWLLAGERGERWRVKLPGPRHGARAAPAATRGETTVFRAPEPLIDIERWQRRWLFVGESGATYLSETPLGRITRALPPPASLADVAPGRRALVGVDQLGRVRRFAGDRWLTPVADDACAARCRRCATSTGCRRLTQIAGVGGKLLALAVPEALLESSDDGQHFTPLDSAPFGARRLRRAADGGIIVAGASVSKHFDGSTLRDAAPSGARAGAPVERLQATIPRRGPRASSIAAGHAALAGSHYYEVFTATKTEPAEAPSPARAGKAARRASEDFTRWRLASGQLGGKLRVRPLRFDTRCDDVGISAAGDTALVACLRPAGGRTEVVLAHHDPESGSTSPLITLVAPETDIGVLAFADGGALVVGACAEPAADAAPPDAGSSRGARCDGSGLLRISSKGEAHPVRAPELSGRAKSLARSSDDQRAYFFGRRAKDGNTALFVSRDAGRSFSPHALKPPKGAGPAVRVDDDGTGAIFVGEHGEVGLVLDRSPAVIAVADADGRIEQIAKLPSRMQAFGGYGRRILAASTLSRATAEPASLALWESTDGGRSFERLALPIELRRDELTEQLAIDCSSAGCIVGSRLTRVGWGSAGQGAGPLRTRATALSSTTEPAVQPSVACRLSSSSPWRTIDAVHADTRAPGRILPHTGHIMMGAAAWAVLRHDQKTGETAVIRMPLDAPSTLKRRVLFGPVRDRAQVAYTIAPQMEGWAAARARLGKRQTDRALQLELAWVNLLTGVRGAATVPAPSLSRTEDITPGERPALMLGMLSVSPRGLLVRPSPRDPLTLVLSPMGKELARGAYPDWPATTAQHSLSDALLVGSRALGIAMHAFAPDDGASVFSSAPIGAAATAAATAPRFFTFAAEPRQGRYVMTSWTYQGARVGVVSYVIDVEGPDGYASFQAFTEQGGVAAPVALPTQLDLPPQPRACSDAARRDSPRMVAPYAPGTRHPVLVAEVGSQLTLLTDGAVLHGSPGAPCVAGWHAKSLRGAKPEMVAVLTGALDRGWLLRTTPRAPDALEYRPMRCHFARDVAIPGALWREPGTIVRR